MNSVTTTLIKVMLLSLVASITSAADVPPDIADMQVQDLRAGGDEKMRYFVIHNPTTPPAQGWRTLFVLPGGSGDAEFQPFVTRIAKNALPEGYLVVQLVAPVWTAQQAKDIVWPTDRSRFTEMKFSTTDFFLAVRAEVEKANKLDPRYSFTLAWSSSGMSGYELSLLPKAGVTGTFVAMSVFHPGALPSLAAAKGQPYFLYHSPQDFIPISQAQAARDALQKAGATVELQTYEGGHGWRGNIFGGIRQGIEWLEKFHDLTVSQGSTGNVFSNGRATDLSIDHHRHGPYENLFTQLDAGLGMRLWTSGGSSGQGKHAAAGAVFWNIKSKKDLAMPSADFAPDGGLVLAGLKLRARKSEVGRHHFENISPGSLEPPDLHEAQRQRRLGSVEAADKAIGQTWTSASGVSIQAKFVRLEDENLLLIKDGKVFTVPLQNLSPASAGQARALEAQRGGR